LRALVADNGISMSIDLADLRGYHYHSGVVFAAYSAGMPNAVALGGRYDEVGKAFGRARPATGFSIDLRDLARATTAPSVRSGILVPWDGDPGLAQTVARLRTQGEVVVYDLPGHEGVRGELKCDRQLVRHDQAWVIEKL
jgi:ATP phosphoribosyltransferase regulatory subunit